MEFWTYSCINCIRVLPHTKAWHAKYKDQGLVVIGVHTPEYGYEKRLPNLEAAVKRFGITYPVAQDNDYRTWNAYRNQYWPALYLSIGTVASFTGILARASTGRPKRRFSNCFRPDRVRLLPAGSGLRPCSAKTSPARGALRLFLRMNTAQPHN